MTYGIPAKLDTVNQIQNTMPYLWKTKPYANGLIVSVGELFQEIEDLFQSILTGRNIYDAVGAQLDMIGALLNEPRDGRLDEAYRTVLLAKVSTIGASGTIRDVSNASKLITDSTFCRVFEQDLLCLYVLVNNPVTLSEANAIEEACIAGARSRVMFTPTEKYVKCSLSTESAVLEVECGEPLFECGSEFSELGGDSGTILDGYGAAYLGFTSLVEGATEYETIDDRGVLCSLSSSSEESLNTGYLIDDANEYILNDAGINIRYIE